MKTTYAPAKEVPQIFVVAYLIHKAIPFFCCLLSNAFSDFGSVGRKNRKKRKNKIGKLYGARRPGTSA